MTQSDFERQNEAVWIQLEKFIEVSSRRRSKRRKKKQADLSLVIPPKLFTRLYRQSCQHLDLARQRHYGQQLVARLNDLVTRAHHVLYGERVLRPGRVFDTLLVAFPRAVRQNAGLFWLSSLLFYGPFVLMVVLIQIWPDMTYSVLDPDMVDSVEVMYSNGPGEMERDSDSDVLMFGYYIMNNTSIGLRTFGSGLLAGLGSIFFLLFNGIYIGAVFGHLAAVGLGHNLYPFVVGHGSFELTAIVISGMTGIKLGLSILKPGRHRRLVALRLMAKECLPLVYGFMAMFIVAAFIEGFWSSSSFSPNVKYVCGGVLWLLVALHLGVSGRRRHA